MKNNNLHFKVSIKEIKLEFIIYNSNDDNDLVQVNDVKVSWPNYMKIIPKMIKYVNDKNYNLVDNNETSIEISRMLTKITRIINEKE